MHQATASPTAWEALQRIAVLFALESEIRGQPPNRRAAARQEQARPLLDGLRAFLDGLLTRISGKSALAQAIRYALSRWTALDRYADDGRLEMSNNAAERSIRPLALGRKNYLFCGSDAGGERAACLYTIIETAKINATDPQAYLTDILARIADHPSHQIDDLLPLAMETDHNNRAGDRRGQPLTLTTSLAHAREAIAVGADDYNAKRPYSALGYAIPAAYAAGLRLAAPRPVATVVDDGDNTRRPLVPAG